MSYLVLARKYRPTTFAQLVGQDHIVRTLRNAIALGRVHHAFLFTGARGVGKTTTARLLARALNCEKGASITPCGTCGACVELLGHGAADVLEIDGASNTGVDSVRELREAVRYMPAKMRHKLYIIDEVHMLSQAAFNALLKTLEEPPPHVKFIFATTEPHKIPMTILSRCQRFDFRRVALPQLTAHLRHILQQEAIALGPEAVGQVARQADGSVRDALSLLDQVLSYAGDSPSDAMVLEALGAIDRQSIAALCDAVLARDAAALLRLIHDLEVRGHDLAEAAALFSEHLRDVAVAKHVPDSASALPERSAGELEALAAQAAQRSHADWQRLFIQAVAVAEDIQRSIHPRVSLEMGLLRLLEVAPTVDLENLMARIDDLMVHSAHGGAVPQTGAGADGPKAEAPGGQPGPPGAAPTPSRNPARAVPPPPPPPSPAEAPTPVDVLDAPDAAHTAWRRYVERVRQVRPALASVLEHGRLLAFGPEGVQIAYVQGTFYWDAACDEENRALLLRQLATHFDQAVPLRILAQADAVGVVAPTLAETSEKMRQAHMGTLEARAREHVAVRAAVSILGGEIQAIRTLQP